jgi:hypothetical protein
MRGILVILIHLVNINEFSFINYIIQEFYFLIHFISNLEDTKIDLTKLKFEACSLFQTLYSILDKCFKNEKYLNNKFLLNSISLIINKFYYNLNLILNKNNKSNNKSIVELLFSIFETTNFLNLCFEEENCTSKENEIETGLQCHQLKQAH